MTVEKINQNPDSSFLTFNRSITIGGHRFVLNSQWRWQKYQEKNDTCTPCGKKRTKRNYLIVADVDGNELDTGIWVDAAYVVEETQKRARVDREIWNERRGDELVDQGGMYVPDNEKAGMPMHDKNGYIQINENTIPTPPKEV